MERVSPVSHVEKCGVEHWCNLIDCDNDISGCCFAIFIPASTLVSSFAASVILDLSSIMNESKPVQDHELFENGENNYQEDLRFSQLTQDELETEKHLRRRIDSRIMPLVILVYLMNYMSVLRLISHHQLI